MARVKHVSAAAAGSTPGWALPAASAQDRLALWRRGFQLVEDLPQAPNPRRQLKLIVLDDAAQRADQLVALGVRQVEPRL